MKKAVMILAAIAILFGCSEDNFIGSGDTISEFRYVDFFNEVSSEGTFNVTITKGDEQTVEIIADDNIMQHVRTDVINGKLKLHLADGSYNNVHLEAFITVLDLKEIENSGAGDMHIYNNTDVQQFKAINSGSASIYLEGSCNYLDIQNEGSGSIFASVMPAENCHIKIEGSGNVEVNCVSNLDVRIEGSGSVYYRGNPLINTTISGSGKVVNDN
jgi:hypothetical protein